MRDAMLDIATELRGWRAEREAEGYEALADVPPRRMVDGVGDYVLLWTRAVHSVVAADLGERLIQQTTTPLGHDRAEPVLLQADRHWRNVRHAVRDFLGRPHVDVELI